MAMLIKAATPIWQLLAYLTGTLAAILLIGGIVLAIRGATASTTMTLFGNEFSSTSVGISMAFLGIVFAVLLLRRILGSVDKVTTGEGPPSAQ